ncbi:hypothetical protein MKZ38_003610 [Zalerion maritima]|uniref:6-phosphogluconate dehydrogenase NADP-binding domain-containing protein n=1 Tax=Zalerion maritima TaxID=339359 RepID=A0AAD5RMF6_9PEZI|nr:hypothetical protein MKZ38_003610 [Zalerion maritima]
MAPCILWAGLGNMGKGMVKNIAAKGPVDSPILVYNRTAARAEELCASLPSGKTKAVTSLPGAAAEADIIFTCVGDDAAVTSIVESILPSVKNKLVVDCSTIHPDTTTSLASKILAAGGEFVACPVFGAPAAADAGALICVLAGPAASVAKAKPYCTGVIAKAEIDMSDKPYATALRLKVLGNTFIFNMVEQVAEGHVAAEKTGMGTEYMHQFIELLFPGVYSAYSNRMLSGDYYQRERPLFQVDLAQKDVRHAKSLAQSAGLKLGNLEVAAAHLNGVKEHMGVRGDIAGIYGAVREEAGLKFENGP